MNKLNRVDISVIIVNFHSLPDIHNCLKSLTNKTPSGINFEVIICSNSPEKKTDVDQLLSLYNSVSFVEMGDNLGFAKANNQGAKYAKGEFLLFLNPDTEFINDALVHLLDELKKNIDAGLIGPALYDENDQPFASVRSDISISNLISIAIPFGHIIFGKKSYNPYILEKTSQVDVVQGSAMFISNSLFEKIGMMNEDFFLYSEERDLCIKVRKHGLKVLFSTKPKIRHIGGTSTSPYFIKLEKEKQISLKKYILKHHSDLLFLFRICYIIGYSWRTIGSVLTFNKRKTKQFATILHWYLIDWGLK